MNVANFEKLELVAPDEELFQSLLNEISPISNAVISNWGDMTRARHIIEGYTRTIMQEFGGSKLVFTDARTATIAIPKYIEGQTRVEGFANFLSRNVDNVAIEKSESIERALTRTEEVIRRLGAGACSLQSGNQWSVWLKSQGHFNQAPSVDLLEMNHTQPIDPEEVYTTNSFHTAIRGEALIGGAVDPGLIVTGAFTDLRAVIRPENSLADVA